MYALAGAALAVTLRCHVYFDYFKKISVLLPRPMV